MEITHKQKAVLNAIKELISLKGNSPTLEEIRDYLGYANTSSVQRHTDALKAKNLLKSDPKKRRSIEIINKISKFINIPLVGEIACGKPSYAEEDIEGYIPYQANRIKGDSKDYFFLRAVGDSMDRAGISDGDFILIRKDLAPEDGDKVVALIGDEATVKVLKKKGNGIVLEPRSNNPVHKPIYIFEETLIQGKVYDIIKH
jgi:repressor LexA